MVDIQRQLLPYNAEQMFDLVADVERYPEFLPWVIDARVRRHDPRTLFVSMTVASGPLRKRFTTRAVLDRPNSDRCAEHRPAVYSLSAALDF